MWHSFFEHLRECGRDATLFILALFGFFPLCALICYLADQQIHWTIWAGLVLSVAAILLRCCWLVRRPERLGPVPPLSQKDWRAARAKLLRNRHPSRASALGSAPVIDPSRFDLRY